MSRTVLHGIDQSVPSFAKLPAKGHWAHRVLTEDLQAPFYWDNSAKIYIPDGIIKFKYDFATHGGAIGDISLGITVPANMIILDGMLDIVTALTAGGAATFALKLQSTGDVLGATAIASLGLGRKDVVPVGTAATAIKTTAARTLTATVASYALTAGKLYGFLRCARSFT